MTRFAVKRGRDAYVIEEAVIEANSKEEALAIAQSDENVPWDSTDETRQFDDAKILTDEVEVLPPTITLLNALLSDVERDQILAALRLWQATKDIPLEIHEIACNGREATMTDPEIDRLCEELNTTETWEGEELVETVAESA